MSETPPLADSEEPRWFLIEMGCAECGDMPLALPRGLYSSESEGRAAADAGSNAAWFAHPDGGSFTQRGSGGFWCAPITALAAKGTPFGSEYDEAFRPEHRLSLEGKQS